MTNNTKRQKPFLASMLLNVMMLLLLLLLRVVVPSQCTTAGDNTQVPSSIIYNHNNALDHDHNNIIDPTTSCNVPLILSSNIERFHFGGDDGHMEGGMITTKATKTPPNDNNNTSLSECSSHHDVVLVEDSDFVTWWCEGAIKSYYSNVDSYSNEGYSWEEDDVHRWRNSSYPPRMMCAYTPFSSHDGDSSPSSSSVAATVAHIIDIAVVASPESSPTHSNMQLPATTSSIETAPPPTQTTTTTTTTTTTFNKKANVIGRRRNNNVEQPAWSFSASAFEIPIAPPTVSMPLQHCVPSSPTPAPTQIPTMIMPTQQIPTSMISVPDPTLVPTLVPTVVPKKISTKRRT